MKAKLKVIKDWEFEEFELTGTSFKYSPTGCKGMVARSEDEIVFWTYHLAQKCSGVLWVKGEVSRWIPSPEPVPVSTSPCTLPNEPDHHPHRIRRR